MWISKKKYKAIEKRMAHIESLLQRMPELIATSICLEMERQKEIEKQGRKYSKSIIICPVSDR